MNKSDKVLAILLIGTLWGAIELFGGELFRAWDVPNKSALLFGLTLIVIYASKNLVDFVGSAVIMAAIASLFKTASSNFYSCQVAAVMINGIIFDGTYLLFKKQFDSSAAVRSVIAPIMAYMSFAIIRDIRGIYYQRKKTGPQAACRGSPIFFRPAACMPRCFRLLR